MGRIDEVEALSEFVPHILFTLLLLVVAELNVSLDEAGEMERVRSAPSKRVEKEVPVVETRLSLDNEGICAGNGSNDNLEGETDLASPPLDAELGRKKGDDIRLLNTGICELN